jgi:hypothetical protein
MRKKVLAILSGVAIVAVGRIRLLPALWLVLRWRRESPRHYAQTEFPSGNKVKHG